MGSFCCIRHRQRYVSIGFRGRSAIDEFTSVIVRRGLASPTSLSTARACEQSVSHISCALSRVDQSYGYGN